VFDQLSKNKNTQQIQTEGNDSFGCSDEMLRLLINSTGEGVYAVDLEGNCIFANPACAKLLGFENEHVLLGKHMHNLVHHTRPSGDPYPVEECQIYKAFRKHESTHVDDEVMFCADGNPFPAEYWSYPIVREEQLMGCVVTFTDISERRRNEQLLADQSAKIAEIARFPEMNPGSTIRLDNKGTVLMANNAAKHVFGEELVGCCWIDLCPGISKKTWKSILKNKEGFVLEARIAQKDYIFTHRRDFEAELVFVFGADITKQKEAEGMVRMLLNSTGEGIYAVDLQGNCTFANPACVKLLGFKSDTDLIGKHMHNLVHHTRPNGDPYPVEECRIYQAFHNNEGTHVDDEVMFSSDGNPFPAEYWSYPIVHDDKLEGCVVTFVDISVRRRVEEELRQSEKMAALGKLSAGLAHELNNPAAAAGRAASQLIEGFDELQSSTIELARSGIKPEMWDSLIKYYKEFLKRTSEPLDLSPLEASDLENELQDWLESHGIEDGWDIAPILVKIRIDNNDLQEISETLPDVPLDKILVWLCKNLDTRELAGTVVHSTQRMSELVGVVKSYSHMDRAKEQYVDVHRGLEDTLIILGHKLRRGIEVKRDYDKQLPKVLTGGSELNQVWTNLIDNAVSAMGEKGTLNIKTYKDNNHITVEISDSGPGIPEEIQSKIFDPFFTTKQVGEGTGLGLDVVRRIITARCGGEVDFKSNSEGTTFYIRLPIE